MLGGVNYKRLTADGAIGAPAAALCGVIVEGGADVGTVAVYDGPDSTGTLICTLDVAANSTLSVLPSFPIQLTDKSGDIAIVLGGTADPAAVTILWK